MIANFLYRVADYFHQNRAKVVKVLLLAVAALLAFLLIRAGVEKWQKARYEKHIQSLEIEVQAKEAKALEKEREADALKLAAKAKEAEVKELEARAEIAETNLRNTRRIVAPLKEAYEQTRNIPLPDSPVSCADVCRQLAGLGYPCQ